MPPEHDSPLVIYANAVESFEVVFQRFETVAWWRLKINQVGSAIEVVKFLACSLEDVGRKPFQEPKWSFVEDRFCCVVPE